MDGGGRISAQDDPLGRELLEQCGIDDLEGLASRCSVARRMVGRSATRWASAGLLPAITMAVHHRGWPAHLVERSLLHIAGDPATSSPMRLVEAGPWWEYVEEPDAVEGQQLARWEARLDELAGRRPAVQVEARAELAAEHLPLTRASVIRRATVYSSGTRSGSGVGHEVPDMHS